MFEITDEYLNYAGFESLTGEARESLRQQATESVGRKIGDAVAEAVGAERARELEGLLSGDADKVVDWFADNDIDIEKIVRDCMESTLSDLQALRKSAEEAV